MKSGEAWPGRVFKRMPVRAMTRPRSHGASLLKRGELVSDHLIRFPGTSWQEIEALPSIMGMPARLTCGTPAWARPLAAVCRKAGMMQTRAGSGLLAGEVVFASPKIKDR